MDSIAVSDSLAANSHPHPHPHPQLDVSASLVELELNVDNLIAIPRTQLDVPVINQLTIIMDRIEFLIKTILVIFLSLSDQQMDIFKTMASVISIPLKMIEVELSGVYDAGYPTYIRNPTIFEHDISNFTNPERNGAISKKIREMFLSIPINDVRVECSYLYDFFPKPIPTHAGNFVKDLVKGRNGFYDFTDEERAKDEYKEWKRKKASVLDKFAMYVYQRRDIISQRYKARHPTVGPLKALINKLEDINLELDCFLSGEPPFFLQY
jgi:hypothetical protein